MSDLTDLLTRALALYDARQSRAEHPAGSFKHGEGWYPAGEERRPCCADIEEPTAKYPWSLMLHCRTALHVAQLIGLPYQDLRAALDERRQSARSGRPRQPQKEVKDSYQPGDWVTFAIGRDRTLGQYIIWDESHAAHEPSPTLIARVVGVTRSRVQVEVVDQEHPYRPRAEQVLRSVGATRIAPRRRPKTEEELDAERRAPARKLLAQRPIFLDTETTGLGMYDEIVEIGIVDADGATLLSTLIRPTHPIPAEATAIHGIGDADVALAPSFAAVWSRLAEILRGRRVGIYNAEFDLAMLYQSARQAGVTDAESSDDFRTAADFRRTCVMHMYAAYYGEWSEYHGDYKWQSLGAAAWQMGIDLPPGLHPHRALADAETARQVVLKMAGDSWPSPLAGAKEE